MLVTLTGAIPLLGQKTGVRTTEELDVELDHVIQARACPGVRACHTPEEPPAARRFKVPLVQQAFSNQVVADSGEIGGKRDEPTRGRGPWDFACVVALVVVVVAAVGFGRGVAITATAARPAPGTSGERSSTRATTAVAAASTAVGPPRITTPSGSGRA